MPSTPDWSAWSREAVQMMQARNAAFIAELSLANRRYEWSFEDALLAFPDAGGRVEADLCVLGSISLHSGTFLWAWANDAIPIKARRDVARVRQFGTDNDLGLLTTAEWRGGHAEALEMAAIGARVLDAAGVWIAPTGDVTLFFALSNLRRGSASTEPSKAHR